MESIERLPEIINLCDGCIPEVGVILKGNEVFPVWDQHPETVILNLFWGEQLPIGSFWDDQSLIIELCQ